MLSCRYPFSDPEDDVASAPDTQTDLFCYDCEQGLRGGWLDEQQGQPEEADTSVVHQHLADHRKCGVSRT